MANNKASDWLPPVSFYFRVDFQRGKEHFTASFLEVNGLEMEWKGKEHMDNTAARSVLPVALTHGSITLKRPVSPLSEPFTGWINRCFGYMESKNRKMETFDMVIKLLDKDGKPLAGWLGRHAYPVKWALGGLDAAKSDFANETVTMACAGLKRITNIC